MKKHTGSRGAMMIEVLVTGVMVATASLGAAAALISGLTLESKSDRTMSEVATAENLMERIRHSSSSDFAQMRLDYHAKTFGSREATGGDQKVMDEVLQEQIRVIEAKIEGGTFTEEEVTEMRYEIASLQKSFESTVTNKRRLAISMPTREADLPSTMDLDGNGEFDNVVAVADARMMVVDVAGSDSLRLRTAVLNYGKMGGIVLDRTPDSGNRPVAFGETRENPPPPKVGVPPPPKDVKTESLVSVVSATLEGNNAIVVVRNTGSTPRKPTSITIAPNDNNLYFESVKLDGSPIYTSVDGQKPGTITIDLTTESTIKTGEAGIGVAGFFKIDKKKGNVATTPKSVTITVAFDDGSVFTADAS